MHPVDKAALKTGNIDLIAGASSSGALEVDGTKAESEQPYPGVLRSKLRLAAGPHRLAVTDGTSRNEIEVFVGPSAPAGFAAFRDHPPGPGVTCTQCHEVNRRGRLAFKGGCLDCHQQAKFTSVHPPHTPEMLSECGICHNAHGSTAKALLTGDRQVLCKQCHN